MQVHIRFLKLLIACLVALCMGFHDELEGASPQASSAARPIQAKEPVDYVNPNIGGIGHLLTATAPTVQLPYGMMRLSPMTTPGIMDRYLADKIYGFPIAGFTLMPIAGSAETDPAKVASLYDHDLETATPYYWAALLEKYDVRVEYTVSQRAAYFRIAFPEAVAAHVLFRLRRDGEISLLNLTSMAGHETTAPAATYFYAEFSKPVVASNTLTEIQIPPERRQAAGIGLGITTDFAPAAGEHIGIRIGMSYISVDQARRNLLTEIPQWDFDQIRLRARAIWNRELGKIAIKGGTEDQRTIFYTALYRTVSRMTDISESGQYYSGYDNKVHSAEGRGFYSNDGLWDTYRSAHPLQLILDPKRQEDMVRSYILMYEQSGWLPTFPSITGGQRGMIGHHSIALIADTYMKGYRDFDIEKAYQAMKKMATESTVLTRRYGPATPLDRVYLEKGFLPALAKNEKETVKEVDSFEKRQSVAVTLETCYDEWCLAQMAKELNKQEDYDYFIRRAHNYENLFDKRIGMMAPKTADGSWKYKPEEFDPIWAGGQGGRDYYAEMNAWTYTWHVQQDVAGLINLMGGRNPFITKLERIFMQQYRGSPPSGGPGGTKYHFLAWFPDMTGLIGQYAHGNEPSSHIPYLFNYAGQPWKTQRKVREIMKIWYNAGPLGICGDEDGGSLSSWYVLSAMGFYQVCPGRPVYDIGSPIFEETRINLADGKVFTITATNVSAKNKYIQSAELNGRVFNKPWFEHADIVKGGSLVLRMGPRPNTAWGSAPEAAPPSMSPEQPAASN
jgi:predicted alpha-1,2-mannosidase